MTRRNAWMGLVAAVALSLSLTACKDTKTLQENEQLKAQIADLQKQNTQMTSDLQAATANRDALAKENEELRAKLKPKKSKHAAKKTAKRTSKRKHR
jgi:regulator of replication initiation timing